MNTPNPLIPQGTLHGQSLAKSRVRIAVLLIVSIHAVFFSGLLIQGCNRKDQSAQSPESESTNTVTGLGNLDTNYYSSYTPPPGPAPETNFFTTNDLPTFVSPAATSSVPVVTPLTPEPKPEPATKEYIVQRGDVLYRIAKSHGVAVSDIVKLNPDIVPSKILPGQKLNIPEAPEAAPVSGLGFADPSAADSSDKIHVVKARENLTRISRQYGVTVQDLKSANNLTSDRLLVGQKLKVPASAAKPAEAPSARTNVSSLPSVNSPLRQQ